MRVGATDVCAGNPPLDGTTESAAEHVWLPDLRERTTCRRTDSQIARHKARIIGGTGFMRGCAHRPERRGPGDKPRAERPLLRNTDRTHHAGTDVVRARHIVAFERAIDER